MSSRLGCAAGWIAWAAAISALGCVSKPIPDVSLRGPTDWVPTSSEPCEYLSFGILSDYSDEERPGGLANEKTLRDVEQAYSRKFEAIGFRQAAEGETPWLFLRAVLQKSGLRTNAVSGGIELTATPGLHRDYMLARSGGLTSLAPIGLIVATEIGTRWDKIDRTVDLDGVAEANARLAWNKTAPLLFEMCEWKRHLVEEGLTLEDYRRELVEEMQRIRQQHRVSNQHRELYLEVEQ